MQYGRLGMASALVGLAALGAMGSPVSIRKEEERPVPKPVSRDDTKDDGKPRAKKPRVLAAPSGPLYRRDPKALRDAAEAKREMKRQKRIAQRSL